MGQGTFVLVTQRTIHSPLPHKQHILKSCWYHLVSGLPHLGFPWCYTNKICFISILSSMLWNCMNIGNSSYADAHTHTHTFSGPLSGTTQVSRYQKSKTNLDFTGARDSEWQWHQLGHMQVCISLQTDNHASTPSLSFLQAGCPSSCPTNSVKALKAQISYADADQHNPL